MKYSDINLLLIDDDEVFHFISKDFIKNQYPEIHLTNMHRARDALEHLKTLDSQEYPQLIICDLEMPVMDGLEFLEIYDRDLYPVHEDVPIIILSISNNKRQLAKLKTFVSLREIVLKSGLEDTLAYILNKYLKPPQVG